MSEHKRHTIKKIGFYDSGLGGLFVMSHVQKEFPQYDYVFLADEKNLPYGQKSVDELLMYAQACITFLIEKEHCDVVMVACNTLSATVYFTLEQIYKKTHPDTLLLDIITPTIDTLGFDMTYVVFGTHRTIQSHFYQKEITKLYPESNVIEIETKDLAALIEQKASTESYLSSFVPLVPNTPYTAILACTHYGLERETFKKVFPIATSIITQEYIALDLFKFLLHHDTPTSGMVQIYTTKENPVFIQYAQTWFPKIDVTHIDIF